MHHTTRPKGRKRLAFLLVVFCVIAFTIIRELSSINFPHTAANTTRHIPQKIWQLWFEPVSDIKDDELRRFVGSWTSNNPTYRYELLTDKSGRQYVNDSFANEPMIKDTFHRIQDSILRADFLRYLIILKEGGLYKDIDTNCTKEVDLWAPQDPRNSTGCVIGVEYDALGGPPTDGFTDDLSLCQWTFMAVPNHPVLRHVVDSVVGKLLETFGGKGNITAGLDHNVLELTGPVIFTKAVLEGLSLLTGNNVTSADITGLQQSKRFGDVLIMPISAFGSGQSHSASKAWGNSEQLVSHHWRMTWRPEHGVGW